MDQWDGEIGFWERLQSGDVAAWWAQHNEHRIVVTRLLFWLDLKFFHGTSAFLITANVLLHAGTALVLAWAYVRRASRHPGTWAVVAILLAVRLAWMQDDNLNWGFQSQFVAVYLFALAAFATLMATARPGWGRVGATLLLATLSMLSMTNGLVVFPLLVGIAMVMRMPWRVVACLAAAMLVAWLVYFHGYVQPPFHASPLGSLRHPLGVLHFAAAFLGSPLYFLGAPGFLAVGAAVAVAAVMAFLGVGCVRRGELGPYRVFLFAAMAFCISAALLAAMGRLDMGIQAALSSRYTTPALIAWCAALLFLVDVLPVGWSWRVLALVGLVGMPLLVLGQKSLLAPRPILFDRAVALVGPASGVIDGTYLDRMYPPGSQATLLHYMAYAQQQRLSVYGHDWPSQLGRVTFNPDKVDTQLCRGSFDGFDALDGALRLSGWALDDHGRPVDMLVVVDEAGSVVGYGAGGEPRPDVAAAIPGAAPDGGFRAYAKGYRGLIDVYGYIDGGFCPLARVTPIPPG